MNYKTILISAKQDLKELCNTAGVSNYKEFKKENDRLTKEIPFRDYQNVLDQVMYIKKLKATVKKIKKLKKELS